MAENNVLHVLLCSREKNIDPHQILTAEQFSSVLGRVSI
jgi:hypothetical protein